MTKLKQFCDQFKYFLGHYTRRPKTKGRPRLLKTNKKTVNLTVLSGLTFVLLVGLLGGIRAMTLSSKVTNLEKAVSTAKKTTPTASTTPTVDNRLQYYLNDFVYYYFTIPEDSDGQATQAKKLLEFYGAEPDILSQGQTKTPSKLNWSRLLKIEANVATYEVHYIQLVKEEKNNVEKKLSTAFNIPFTNTGDGYYVSGLPWFSNLTDNQADEVETTLELGNDDHLSTQSKEKLDKFLELFFINYTTDQSNLDLISDGVPMLENTTFKTLDYTYYKEEKENIIAYAQVTFDVSGSTHSENFTLTLSKKGKSNYVNQLNHTIPTNYAYTK